MLNRSHRILDKNARVLDASSTRATETPAGADGHDPVLLKKAKPNPARITTYRASPKALPASAREGHFSLSYDHIGDNGKMSLRRAGHMHHLGLGADHRGKRVVALIDETTVTVVHLDTGEIIATNTIDPDHSYWRNTQKVPGRWPGTFQK